MIVDLAVEVNMGDTDVRVAMLAHRIPRAESMCDDERVPGEPADGDELGGFDVAAKRAVARAEVEARGLSHDRVGTEHLLLGLLAGGDGQVGTRAAGVLHEAGLTFAAARHKVREAGGTTARQAGPDEPARLVRTARASRAIGRSIRFSHTHRAHAVSSEHLLLGVLDVEGTAGQVLRGLGFDVEQLRATLLAPTAAATASPVEHAPEPTDVSAATPQPVGCPTCGASLANTLRSQAMSATGEVERRVAVYSCDLCGTFLGLTDLTAS